MKQLPLRLIDTRCNVLMYLALVFGCFLLTGCETQSQEKGRLLPETADEQVMPTEKNALDEAKLLIAQHQADCVLVKEGKMIARYSGRGVMPILTMYQNQASNMPGAILVDRVIGRAAAAVAICGKCSEVQTELISQDAVELLKKNQVTAQYNQLVPRILNSDKTDICPMEKLVEPFDQPEDMLKALKEKIMTGTNSAEKSKALVLYFSHSGNTRVIANQIKELTNADIYEVKPVDAYPTDYDTVVKQAKKEIDAGYRPAIQPSAFNLDDYDIIYLGSPCWWSTIAPPLATLLEKSNLEGKTIAPFMTHEGSGMGRSVADIRKMCPKSTVVSSLAIWGSRVTSAKPDVQRWIQDLKK